MEIKTFVRRPIVPVVVMASAALLVGLSAFAGIVDKEDSFSAESLNDGAVILHSHALDAVPSSTVTDWAAVADVVVVAEATAEQAHPPAMEDLEPGMDAAPVGRTVTVRPISTIWISPANSQNLPETVELTLMGWVVDPTDPEAPAGKLVTDQGSRVEVGHTYVLGLKWLDAECGEPAEWAVFGSSAALPLDDGVFGLGEFVGEIIEDLDVLDLIPNTVLEEFAGQPASALGDALEAVQDTVQRIPMSEDAPTCDPEDEG